MAKVPLYAWQIEIEENKEQSKEKFIKKNKDLSLNNRYISVDEKIEIMKKNKDISQKDLDEIINDSNNLFIIKHRRKIFKEFSDTLFSKMALIKESERLEFEKKYTNGDVNFYDEFDFDKIIDVFNSLIERKFKRYDHWKNDKERDLAKSKQNISNFEKVNDDDKVRYYKELELSISDELKFMNEIWRRKMPNSPFLSKRSPAEINKAKVRENSNKYSEINKKPTVKVIGPELFVEKNKYDKLKKQIDSLKNKCNKYEQLLETATGDDEIEYKYQLMKLNEKIEPLEKELRVLENKADREAIKRNKIEEENRKIELEKERKDKLYKKLYVTLTECDLELIFISFSLTPSTKDEMIKYLITNYPESKINEKIKLIDDVDAGKINIEDIVPIIKEDISRVEEKYSAICVKLSKCYIEFEISEDDLLEYSINREIYSNHAQENFDYYNLLDSIRDDINGEISLPFDVEIYLC